MFPRLQNAAAAATITAIASSASAACFDVDRHLPNGAFNGGTFQIDANTTISIRPSTFYWPGSPPTPNFTSINMDQQPCHGAQRSLNMNNANMLVQISEMKPIAQQIVVNFCDFGGFENFGAGTVPIQHIGEAALVPANLNTTPPGTSVYALYMPFGGAPNNEGQVSVGTTGSTFNFVEFGGQEFFVQSICVN